jgi:hypothetical protein
VPYGHFSEELIINIQQEWKSNVDSLEECAARRAFTRTCLQRFQAMQTAPLQQPLQTKLTDIIKAIVADEQKLQKHRMDTYFFAANNILGMMSPQDLRALPQYEEFVVTLLDCMPKESRDATLSVKLRKMYETWKQDVNHDQRELYMLLASEAQACVAAANALPGHHNEYTLERFKKGVLQIKLAALMVSESCDASFDESALKNAIAQVSTDLKDDGARLLAAFASLSAPSTALISIGEYKADIATIENAIISVEKMSEVRNSAERYRVVELLQMCCLLMHWISFVSSHCVACECIAAAGPVGNHAEDDRCRSTIRGHPHRRPCHYPIAS